jgi:lysophospholipase L1-like esterase
MKTILCYGDSNTWGMEPGTGVRFARDVRWPGVMREALADGYEVIEEGLGGRTTVFDDPLDDSKNGKTYLVPCLASHQPLDLIVIMLGTNDVQSRFSASAREIAWGMEALVGIAMRYAPVLIIAPAVIVPVPKDEREAYAGAIEKTQALPAFYAEVAELYGCAFLDASQVIVSSTIDGIHLDADQHQKLGTMVAKKVREIV